MPQVPELPEPFGNELLHLRWFRESDAPAVTDACQDGEIHRWTATIPWPYEEHHARFWIALHAEERRLGTAAQFAIVDPDSDDVIGSLGAHRFDWQAGQVTVGYWVAAPHRNRGVASVALTLVTSWLSQMTVITKFELMTKIGNAASERVAEKAGFVCRGPMEGYTPPGSEHAFDVKYCVLS